MKISKNEFTEIPRKCVTLLGMSGSGKTYISSLLSNWGWDIYSCDYEIGRKFLKDELKEFGAVSQENISSLSLFLGKLGDVERGGYPLDLFLKRQKAYYDAECCALSAVLEGINCGSRHFVHDSTGSLCEITDTKLIKQIGKQTLFVYLKADEDDERDILQRAYDYPKPLFFPPSFFKVWLKDYLLLRGFDSTNRIDPDDFSRWVFPKLFESRKPKYQALADSYGVSIPSKAFYGIRSSDDFIRVIADHL